MKNIQLMIICLLMSKLVFAYPDCNDPGDDSPFNYWLKYQADLQLTINGRITADQMFYSVDDISDKDHPIKLIKDKSITPSTDKTKVDIVWDVTPRFELKYEQQNYDKKTFRVTVSGIRYKNKINLTVPIYIIISNNNIQKCKYAPGDPFDPRVPNERYFFNRSSYTQSAYFHPIVTNFTINQPAIPSNTTVCYRNGSCVPDTKLFDSTFTYNFSATVPSKIDVLVDPEEIPIVVSNKTVNVDF